MSFARFLVSPFRFLALFAFAVFSLAGVSFTHAQSLRFAPPIFNVSSANGTNNAVPLLSSPSGVAVDKAGNLYIADSGNVVVRKVSPTQTATIFAGGHFGYAGDNGTANAALIGEPVALAVDPAGNVYISDPQNFAVRKVDTSGIITTFAGGHGGGSSGDNGPATSAKIVPAGIASDALGNIYIVDTLAKTVRVVSLGNIIGTYAGGGSNLGAAANGVPATTALFNAPSGIATDANGNLYIGDLGTYFVSRVDAQGIIHPFAGTALVSGSTGDGGLATSARIGLPYGIAVDPAGNVYITSASTVRAVNTAGIISTIVGASYNGLVFDGVPADHAPIYPPVSLAADVLGNLYLATPIANAVYQVNLHPEVFPQTKVGTSSQPQRLILENYGASNIQLSSFTFGSDFKLSPNLLSQPQPCTQTGTIFSPGSISWCTFDVVFAPTAEGIRSFPLTINSNDTPGTLIQTLTSAGLGSALAMTSGKLYVVAGMHGTSSGPTATGPATSIGLTTPSGVVVDSAGNIYFSEEPFCLVERVDGNTGLMSIFGGTNSIACQPDDGHTIISGDGGPATAAYIPDAGALALDSHNNLYIADAFDGRIREIDTSGKISTFAGLGIGIDFTPSCHYTADGGQASQAFFCFPDSIAFDSAGNLYFVETGNNIIRKVSTSGQLTTVAGNYALGAGFSGDGGPATSAQLNAPIGLAVNAAGDIFIGDTYNQVIRKVSAATGKISTIAGKPGVLNYSGDGGPASAATLQYPKGLTIDAAGDLFVADYQNWVIRKIDTAGIITTVAGNHLSNFYNGDALPATESGLNFPNYIFVAPSGYLYISNQDNGLVQEMSPNGALIFPSTKIGVTSAPESVTVSNIGNMPMHFDPQFPSGITGDFALASGGTCDFTAALAVGASCNINLTFTPTVFGARTGIFGVFDDGIASPQYVALSGTGAQAQPQRIRFNPIPNHVYGDTDFTLSAAADSGLPVTFTVKSGNATVSGFTVHITGVGPVVIVVNQAGLAGSWLPATEVTQGFSVTPAILSVTAQSATSSMLLPLSPLTYVFTGFAYNETPSVLTGVPAITTTATPTSPSGYYPITIGIGTLADPDYTYVFNNSTYYLSPYKIPDAPVKLTATAVINRSDLYQVTVTVTNSGGATAQNVVLTSVKLHAVAGTPASKAMGSIAPGASAVVNISVPLSAGVSGASVVQQIAGTYTGGSFGGSFYATLP